MLDDDVGIATLEDSDDTKFLCLALAAKIIRDCMFINDEQFQGSCNRKKFCTSFSSISY